MFWGHTHSQLSHYENCKSWLRLQLNMNYIVLAHKYQIQKNKTDVIRLTELIILTFVRDGKEQTFQS